MSGNLIKKARRDAKKYITKGGFQVDIVLESSNGIDKINITGWGTVHWHNFDTDGNSVNSKNAHVSIIEDDLKANNFNYRKNKEVHLKGCKIIYKVDSEIERKYEIIEWMPDESLGIIALILGDYDSYN